MSQRGLWTLLFIVATYNAPAECAAITTTIETQRQNFRDIYPAVERGDWAPAAANESLLIDYVLWPDLRAAYLRTRLKKHDLTEIYSFLSRYGSLKPARDIRYRLALRLATDGKHNEFLRLYESFYQGHGIADLDCLALNTRIAIGQTSSVAKQAESLWLIDKSQADECDPVFDYLRNSGQLGIDLYRQRFILATEARQFSLARYLARSIDEEHVVESNRWLAAQKDPETFILQADSSRDDAVYMTQLIYALKNLAYRDPFSARQHWMALEPSFRFSQAQSINVDRHLALWAARLDLPDAATLLAGLPDDSVDDEVIRWRIRAALRQQAWPDVLQYIGSLNPDEEQREEWQYWKAIALRQTSHPDESVLILTRLAEKRSYYGFLAADQLDQPYLFALATIDHDANVVGDLARNPALIRARELYYVGLEGRGRSEWDAVIRSLDATRQKQAAVLAHQWGWHSRAIATAARGGDIDDLEMRYPLPHRQSFERFSSEAHIRESWAYSVARSESLFMRDIRSSAGAIGIMQLLPETGRRTAREINYPYHGRSTLTDPTSNIRLGTFYLGKMYQRFGERAVPATAAYNAGPLRVEQWLPDFGTVDARIWIENIPYDETRSYVRRVLMSDAIFHWRLTGEMRRLSSLLVEISASSRPAQIAAE